MNELDRSDEDFLEAMAGRKDGIHMADALRAHIHKMAEVVAAAGSEAEEPETAESRLRRERALSSLRAKGLFGGLPPTAPMRNPAGNLWTRFLLRLGIESNRRGGATLRMTPAFASALAVVVCGVGFLVYSNLHESKPVLMGPEDTIVSLDPLNKCSELQAALVAAGLRADSQVRVREDSMEQCRVIASDLDEDQDRVAAANVLKKAGIAVEVKGGYEITVVKKK